MKYTTFVSLVFLLTLTACGPLQILDAESGRYAPMQGGVFVLHKDVVMPPGQARIFFQDGAVTSGVNEFRPHCHLKIYTLSDRPQTIVADTFTITRITNRRDQIVQRRPIQLAASVYFGFAVGGNADGGLSREMQVYVFSLQSEQQPDVRFLVCGGAFDDPSDADAPTRQDIAAALGEYGTLTLH